MSYILDALRRSQAERDRGQVPGLHAQPELGGLRTASAATPAAGTPWLALLVGAVLVLAAALAWSIWRTPSPLGTAAVPVPAAAVPSVTAPPVAPAPAAALPTVVSAVSTPAVVSVPTPLVVSVPKPPKPVAAPATQPAPPPAAAPVVTPAVAASPPSTLPTTPPVLTPDMKRDWPPLVVGGSVWSDTASARFVILGGQLLREGESTASGVLVEQITPKAAVLRWRDQRASLPL
jgi:general secretion pathway protein B